MYFELYGQTDELFVSSEDQPAIHGFQASQELDIIKVVMSTKEEKDFKEKYHGVFQRLGCLHEPYHIEIDPETTPVITPPRKMPIHIKDSHSKSRQAN